MLRRSRRSSSALALVDLLITLVVVGALCFFLMPYISDAQVKRNQSFCASNMKQFGIGLLMYAQDNDDTLPPAVLGGPRGSAAALESGWAYVAVPYLQRTPNQLRCPELKMRWGAHAGYADGHPGQTTGYAYNGHYDDALRTSGEKPPVLRSPGSTVLLAEARPGILTLYAPDLADAATPPALVNPRFLEVTAASPEGATRHSEGANYAFVDGHAKWYQPERLLSGPKTDGKSPGFGL